MQPCLTLVAASEGPEVCRRLLLLRLWRFDRVPGEVSQFGLGSLGVSWLPKGLLVIVYQKLFDGSVCSRDAEV